MAVIDIRGVIMLFTPELVAELEILSHYNLTTTGEGIKVHHTAEPAMIAATQRLHDKGLITQTDGGYLTSQGIEVAEHVQAILTILKNT
jgi:uncharacterized protein (TIGR02647 family)